MNNFPHAEPLQRAGALLVQNADNENRQCWSLAPHEPFSIGRADTNTLVLDLRLVSRHHAEISQGQHGYQLRDLCSTNGTLVSGKMIQDKTVPLIDGDLIKIGDVELQFVDEETTEPLVPIVSPYGLTIDAAQRAVLINGVKLDPPLSPPQFELLNLVVEQESQIVTRDKIAAHIWPHDSINGITDQAIDALVNRLRTRLKELAPDHHYIQTVRGHGFQLVQNPS